MMPLSGQPGGCADGVCGGKRVLMWWIADLLGSTRLGSTQGGMREISHTLSSVPGRVSDFRRSEAGHTSSSRVVTLTA